MVCEETLHRFILQVGRRRLYASEKLGDTLEELGSLAKQVHSECEDESRNHEVQPGDEAFACPATQVLMD